MASRLFGLIEALDKAAAEVVHETEYYLRNGGSTVALAFLDDLTRVVGRIAETPHAFPDWSGKPGVKRALLTRYPFAIGFVVGPAGTKDPPLIVVVAHGKRRPGYWLMRTAATPKR